MVLQVLQAYTAMEGIRAQGATAALEESATVDVVHMMHK